MAMTIIGVISDTHRTIPDKALSIFKGDYDLSRVIKSYVVSDAFLHPTQRVDCIIHAGDIGDDPASIHKVLSALSEIAPVFAVMGNCDREGACLDGEPLSPELQTLDIDGLDIAFIHDPVDLTRALKEKNLKPALAIHGHTHRYNIQETESGVRLNPGAIHDPRCDEGYRTVALAYAEDGELKGIDIVRL